MKKRAKARVRIAQVATKNVATYYIPCVLREDAPGAQSKRSGTSFDITSAIIC
jgi:hypothetical protein